MLLAIDIGNTNVLVGCLQNDTIIQQCRLKTDAYRTVDEYEALLFSLWRERFSERISFDSIIISSVVPPLTPTFITICEQRLGCTPLVVGPGVKTGLSIKTRDPAAVGADRVVNAVAARELYGSGAIVIDFGTATSFDVIDPDGSYLGGVIAPGIEVALDALVSRTAKLPRITLDWPASVVGDHTVAAMQSGCMVGYVCMVEGIVGRIMREVKGIQYIIATGGLATTIAAHTTCITECNTDLTLQGMRLIAEMN